MTDEASFQKLQEKVSKLEDATIQAAAALLQASIILNVLRQQFPAMDDQMGTHATELTQRIEKMINKLDESIHAER